MRKQTHTLNRFPLMTATLGGIHFLPWFWNRQPVPRFMVRVALFFFVTCLLWLTVTSPTSAQNLIFEHLSYEQGLSESNVTAIIQDRQGFLWIGTSNGLNRYDGHSVVTYRNDPNDSASLSNNAITALYEDESGTLWVGTQNGLHALDRSTGRFTVYRNNPDNANSLSNNLVRSIIEAPRGMLWVGTKRGLNRLDIARNEWKVWKTDKKGRGKGPSDSDIITILQEPQNRANLWLGTRNGGINKLHLPSGVFTVFKPEMSDNDEMSSGVTAMTFDANGSLWLSTRDNALWRFYTSNNEFTPVESLESSMMNQVVPLSNTRSVSVQALAVDRQGMLWVGTRAGLFSRRIANEAHASDPKSQDLLWQHHANNPNDAQSLSDNAVTVIRQDRSGVLWFGTQAGGVNKYVPQTSAFRNVKYDPLQKSLPSPIVNAIAGKANGELWFGTQNGVVVYVGNSPVRLLAVESVITAILHDSQGSTWLGTENGLVQIESRGIERRFEYSPDKSEGLSDNLVTALAEDRNGNIWIGTQGGGISRFNTHLKTFQNYWSSSDTPGSISDNFVFSILVASDGTVWIGTNNGLNRYNPDTDTFTAFARSSSNAQTNAMPEAPILALYEDAAKHLWLGTLGGGLYRFEPAQKRAVRFSKKDHLPSETIYGILGDTKGKLWLSTSRGLASLTPRGNGEPSIRIYGAADGLQSSAFRKGAYFRTASGTMLFGVGAGFVAFDADSLRDNMMPPSLAVTRFHVFGNNEEAAPAPTQTRFEIDYGENFEIEYAALDFTNPARNEYAYHFGDSDSNWVYMGQNRRITVTNYDPGEYSVFVKASNSDGVWTAEPLVLTLIVRPPWWRTWWSHTLAIVAGIACIVGAYRLRVRRMIASGKRLQTLVDERTKEISEQKYLLEAQGSEIQMTNAALQEKNVELERVLHTSENARQELERAYQLLDRENSRKTQELNEARAFQISMLPKQTPQIQGLDIAFALRTATEVGGDYYDYVLSPDGGLTLAIGDATGHGVRAGMLVSLVKSSFHALVHDYSLSETAAMISQTIKQMRLQRMFMCLSLLHLRRKEHPHHQAWQLEMAGAGMPPMLLYRAATGRVEHLRTQGIVLGTMENAVYPVRHIEVEAGDRLLLMSDGIIELFNASGDELGTQRVEDCFLRLCQDRHECSADAMLAELHYLTDEWVDGEPLHDDIALIMIRVGNEEGIRDKG